MRSLLLLLVAALGGGLMWASFDPIDVAALAFPALVLLALAVRDRSMLFGFLAGTVWGLAFFLPLVSWSWTAVGEPLPWVALSISQALFIGLTGGIWARVSTMPTIPAAILGAFAFAGIEVIRTNFPFGGFPWGMVAFSQVGTPLLRTAPYIAAVGVTFLTVALSLLLASGVRFLYEGPRVEGLILVLTPVLAVALCVSIPLSVRGSETLRVGWVQGGPDVGEHDSGRALNVTLRHEEETMRLLESEPELDLILWPESASDRDIRTTPEAMEIVQRVSAASDVPLLLGTQEYIDDGRYNDYSLIIEGKFVDHYSKSRPVPFGEFIPMRDFFRNFTDAVDQVSTDMLAGEGPAVLDVPVGERTVALAVPICFEIAVDQVVQDAINGGGTALIVPVNSASFGDSAESLQQMEQTIFRAVEHSRSAVQVSTVGVSGVVMPNGTLVAQSDKLEAASGVYGIPLRDELTPATRYGHIYRIVALIGALLSLVWAIARRKERS